MAGLVQKLVVEDAKLASALLPQRVALVNPDGSPFGGSGPRGAKGAPGASVKAISLSKDTGGAIVGGTATLSDGSAIDVTVTQA